MGYWSTELAGEETGEKRQVENIKRYKQPFAKAVSGIHL
jgi:hypothetical protein